MKKYVKRTISIICLIIASVLFISLCQEYVFYHLDNNSVRIDGFYNEEKNSIDVVLFGTSEVYAGYSAGLAYDKYGFTSYPYVIDGNHASLIKSQYKEIQRTQNPKLVAIEVNQFLYADDKLLTDDVNLRRYVDNMPMSKNRIETVLNLEYDNKISCMFPFIKYHGNWQDLSGMYRRIENKLYFKNKATLLKGMATFTGYFANDGNMVDILNDKTEKPLADLTEKYLVDFLEYCKSNEIDNVVFVRFPHRVKEGESYDTFARANTLSRIVKSYGFEYYNFDENIKDMGLDVQKDYYDDDHLNIYGQQKMTTFLGKFFVDKYDITKTDLGDESAKKWQDTVDYTYRYFEYCDECIKQGQNLWPYENKQLIEKLKSR